MLISSFFPEVHINSLNFHRDERGSFAEVQKSTVFKQTNLVHSQNNVLRGLHFQLNKPQAKLLTVIEGTILDVLLDIRPDSPTLGKHFKVILSNNFQYSTYNQIFIPDYFAHGYYVISETATILYQCSEIYNPESSKIIRFDSCDINWSEYTNGKFPIISKQDRFASSFKLVIKEISK